MDAITVQAPAKRLVSLAIAVPILLCVLLLAAYLGVGVRPRLSVVLPGGNRFDVALTRCTSILPAHALVLYTDFAHENRFIHERIFLLTRFPIMPSCP